jgi:DNA-binding LacI/PurR family transcriptional regulator
VEKEKNIPIYQSIVNDIKSKILHGEIKPNEALPTQIELAKVYGTSEITSRRALTELVKEKLIYRVRGKGTFVTDLNKPNVSKNATPLENIYFAHPKAKMHVFNHRFFNDLLNGIHETCENNDIDFFTWDVNHNHGLPKDDKAGIILITHLPGSEEIPLENLQQWKENGHRMLTVIFHYPHLSIPYLMIDSLTGGYLATQHLLSLGHQRIGIILTGKSQIELNQEFSLRLQGYRLALSQHRVDFNPELVYVVKGDQELEEMGYEGLNHLLGLKNPPTAIFATSDNKAIGAINAARNRGLQVPNDISIIGYDDVVAAQYSMPRLTTINQNSFTLGRRAAEMLIFEWDQAKGILKDEIVPQLVIRESTSEYV